MKKIFLTLITASLAFISCERDMTSLNTNPKSPEVIPSRFAFASAEYDMFNTLYNPGTQSNAYHFLNQHLAETTYATPSTFSLDTNSTNHWDLMYVRGLKMLSNAKGILKNEVDADTPAGKNKLAMIEILTCLGFQNLIDTYGDIPYTDALKQESGLLSPKYDDALTTYKALNTRLDEAIALIDDTTPGYTEDAFYKGDMKKWRKLANTIKFGLGINLADVDPALSKEICEKAYLGGMMSSNSDNVMLSYDGGSYKNPFSQTREDIVASNTFVNVLKSKSDPRLGKYFSLKNGTYIGGIFGAKNSYANFSTFNSAISTTNAKGLLIDYSQSEFWLAEGAARNYAVGSAATHFANAIAASMDFWGVAAGDKQAYLDANVYNPTSDYKAQIGLQSWLAGFTKGYFTWNTVRRLDFPVLLIPQTSVLTSYPHRLSYPNSEQNLNKAHWSEAVAKIPGGKDTPTAKVFWDKF